MTLNPPVTKDTTNYHPNRAAQTQVLAYRWAHSWAPRVRALLLAPCDATGHMQEILKQTAMLHKRWPHQLRDTHAITH